ncbi:hypothetical protein DIPPA_17173 [Diplonema papillatum]|nr:hypothetical protein DIPPA_17173 [Diplonema papillatum]
MQLLCDSSSHRRNPYPSHQTSNTVLCYVDIKNVDAGPAHEELCATRLAKPNVEIAVPRNLVLPPDMRPEPESAV